MKKIYKKTVDLFLQGRMFSIPLISVSNFFRICGENQFFTNGVFFCLDTDRRIQSTAEVRRKIELCGLPFSIGLTA